MQADGLKCLKLAQRLEDRAIKFLAQVHFTRKPITETEPYHVVPNVASLNDVDHGYPPIYSSGSIGFNGCRFLARCQFSSSSDLWAAYHSMTCPSARRGNLPVTTPSRMRSVISYSPYVAWKWGGS